MEKHGLSARALKKSEITDRGLNLFLKRNGREAELSQAQASWLRRHGKTVEVKKPYRYKLTDVEVPLGNLKVAMDALALESEKLHAVTKGISEIARSKAIKRKLSKMKLEISVSKKMERSKADLARGKSKMLKKSDDLVVLGVLDGSIKYGEIQGWIEKKAGVR